MLLLFRKVQYFLPDIMHTIAPTVQWAAPAVEIFQLQHLTHLHANANGGNYLQKKVGIGMKRN